MSTLLALGIAAAIIFALLTMGGALKRDFGDGRRLSTFDVRQQGESPRKAAAKSASRQRQVTPQRETPTPRTQPRPPIEAPPLPEQPLHLPGVMILSRADYAASNIGSIRGTAGPPSASGSGDSGAGNDSETVGLGPGGEPLYAAEWYRKPTRAETSTYMPAGRVGWGIIACRTAPRYHVEDCRELGETPGSGISRGLRQAAWQFLVRPPQKGGTPLIGAWVRIRFDIVEGKGPE